MNPTIHVHVHVYTLMCDRFTAHEPPLLGLFVWNGTDLATQAMKTGHFMEMTYKNYLIFHPHHYHEMLITLTSTKKFKLYENSPILFKQVWSDGETNTLIDVPETRSSKNVTLHFEVPCIEGEMAPCVPVKKYNFESNCTKVKFITLPVKKSKMSNCTTLPLKKSHVKLYYIHLHWRKKSHITCQIVLHLTDRRKSYVITLHLQWREKVTTNRENNLEQHLHVSYYTGKSLICNCRLIFPFT